MTEPLRIHVVSHSHWDREWHSPFQVFRIRLLKMVDCLLEILERDARYRSFVLDGQSVILEDYPEIAGHRLDDLRHYIQQGRILVGPWYVLADEFLVSAESLIRNLYIGHKIARQFGSVMPVGYLPDAFGHTGAMPALLQGFGIDSALLWRGVPEEVKTLEFCWRSPDGAEVLTVYLPLGYSAGQALPSEPEPLAARLRYLREQIEPFATGPDILVMNGGDHALPQAELPQILEQANRSLDGVEVVHSSLPEYVEAVRQHWNGCQPVSVEGELRSPARAHVLPGVLSTRIWIKQRNAASQRLLERWTEPFAAWAQLFTVPRQNAQVPDAAFVPLIEQAWRYLLHNHAHDSICGCGIDQVHAEMRNYFDWADQIGETLANESLRRIASSVDTASAKSVDLQHAVPVVVFNPLDGPRRDYQESAIVVPAEAADLSIVNALGQHLPSQMLSQQESTLISAEVGRAELQGFLGMLGAEPGVQWTPERIDALEGLLTLVGDFQMPRVVVARVDIRPGLHPESIVVEVGITDRGEHNHRAIEAGLNELTTLVARGDVTMFRLLVKRREEVRLGFVAELPAYGYDTLYVVPGQRRTVVGAAADAAPLIENQYFSVRASQIDGTVTLIDKRSGMVLNGLNRFVDSGDAGDEYNYSPPGADLIIDRPAVVRGLEVLEQGPVRWVLRVSQELSVPVALADDRSSRSFEQVRMPITTDILLYHGIPRIEFRAEVDNPARDHRLRVLFPTRIRTDIAIADGHFGPVMRLIQPGAASDDAVEQPVGTAPQQEFVAVMDGEVGVMLANRGLPEYEVLPGAQGVTIALTLLRAVGWLSRDDLRTRRGHAGPAIETPGAQLLGKHVFEYCLVPFHGDWMPAAVQARRFTSPPRAVVAAVQEGPLPTAQSFLAVQPGALVVSAVKPAWDGEGIIVRLYNQSDRPVEGALRFVRPISGAWLTNLAEDKRLQELAVDGETVAVQAGPRDIVTVRLEAPAPMPA